MPKFCVGDQVRIISKSEVYKRYGKNPPYAMSFIGYGQDVEITRINNVDTYEVKPIYSSGRWIVNVELVEPMEPVMEIDFDEISCLL